MSDEDGQLTGGPHTDADMTGPGNPADVLPGDVGDLMDDPDETPDDDDPVEDETDG